jgi:hypothetical protein
MSSSIHFLIPSSSRANGNANAGYSNPTRQPLQPQADTSNANHAKHGTPLLNSERVQASLRKSLSFMVHLTAKFPLVFMFLIVMYVIPASAGVLLLYILITVLFALLSFSILYFAYPSLDWLVREIFA